MTILLRESFRKRSRVIAAMVCSLSLAVMAAGCGKAEETVPVDLSLASMEELEEETSGYTDAAGETEQDRAQSDNEQQTQDQQTQAVGSAELSGNVYSLSQDSFVVSRTENWSEGDAELAVSVAPGYEQEEDLTTVYVSENCSYQYKTVKNGGINPEDISTREGNFADLQEGISVIINGSWRDDDSFHADSIVMSSFE